MLVVDDEFTIVDTLVDILQWEGYATVTAADGDVALAIVQQRVPALVLLDYMMPVMDGFVLLNRLRGDPKYCDLKVIMMTAAPLSIPEEKDRKWDALLAKPFTAEQLLGAVEKLIGPGQKAE